VAARRGSAWVELAAKSHGRKCVRRPRTRARAASKDSRRGESGDLQVPREEDAGEATAGLGEEVPARKEQREGARADPGRGHGVLSFARWTREGEERRWREGEGTVWAAIYRAKIWTCQPAAAGGRCYSDNLGRRVLAVSA
jgi:hypothetical protein